MRALLSIALLVIAARPAVADETWAPISVEGIEYEVRLPLAADGLQSYRMPPGRLEETLERLGRRVANLSSDLEGANLPSDLLAAPGRIFAQVASAARAMGPDLVFSNPPRLGDDVAQFSFDDGVRQVSFAVSSPLVDNVSQQIDVVYRKRVAGEWKVERRQTLLLDRKKADEMAEEKRAGRARFGQLGSPWLRAWYSETRGTENGRPRPVARLVYDALERPGQWVGSEFRRGQGRRRFVLRSLDRWTGRLIEARVGAADADRLFGLASRTYRVPLPASHPDFDRGVVTRRELSTEALAEAGLETVVDRRGRAYLRRSERGVDRAALRRLGVTYVKPAAGRKAHLRHLRARPPRRAVR